MTDARVSGPGGRLDRLARADGFRRLTVTMIVLVALLMGVEAMPAWAAQVETVLLVAFAAAQAWFVFEIAVRLGAHWPRLRTFFADGWNTFDFVVVVLSLVPAVGALALVARLLRVLRLLRVVSGVNVLRAFVRGELPLPARLAATALLAALAVYVLALAGFQVFGAFGEGDPAWTDLFRALRSTVATYALSPAVPAGMAGAGWLTAFAATHAVLLALLVRPRRAAAP
jgi:hypothetical protein